MLDTVEQLTNCLYYDSFRTKDVLFGFGEDSVKVLADCLKDPDLLLKRSRVLIAAPDKDRERAQCERFQFDCISILSEIIRSKEITDFKSESIDIMVKALKFGLAGFNSDLKIACAHTLGQIKDKRAAQALLYSSEDLPFGPLKGPDELSTARINSLAKIGEKDEETFNFLLAELTWTYKKDCANALAIIRNPKASKALLESLEDPHVIPDQFEFTFACAKALVAIARTDETTFQLLLKKLTDKNHEVSLCCAIALEEIKDLRAVESLLLGLKYNYGLVRLYCATALGLIKDPRAAKGLIEGLADENYNVRNVCINVLGEIGKIDETTFQLLLKGLTNADISVKCGFATALGLIEDPRAVDKLVISLASGDFSVLQDCLTALKKNKRPERAKLNKNIF